METPLDRLVVFLALVGVVASCSQARAHSSAVLSGKANIGLQKTGAARAALQSGADGANSRLIFRGVEDLGDGLKAQFHLEHGFLLNNASADSVFFQRQSWAGLSSALGEVRLGRQYTLGYLASISTMPSTYSDPQQGVGLGYHGMASRNSDQIQYWSPNRAGVQLRVSTQLKGDTGAGVRHHEFALHYTRGLLAVNMTYADVSNASENPMGLNVAFNFDRATVVAGVVNTGAGQNGVFVGTVVPFGSARLFANHANNSTTRKNGFDFGAFYTLSKRTRLYAVFGAGNQDLTTRTAVGVDHNF